MNNSFNRFILFSVSSHSSVEIESLVSPPPEYMQKCFVSKFAQRIFT